MVVWLADAGMSYVVVFDRLGVKTRRQCFFDPQLLSILSVRSNASLHRADPYSCGNSFALRDIQHQISRMVSLGVVEKPSM